MGYEIYILIFLILLYLYYNNIFENLDIESSSYIQNINKNLNLLNTNQWLNKQTFNEDTIFKKNICINNTCINENHLKILKGEYDIALLNVQSNKALDKFSLDRDFDVNNLYMKWRIKNAY